MKTAEAFIERRARVQGHIPIVLGGHGLGLIQSLGEQGIQSLVVDDGPVSCRDFSKYCWRVDIPALNQDEDMALTTMRAVCEQVTRCSGHLPIIFPTSDYVLSFIEEHYDDLSSMATLLVPDHEALRLTLSKVEFSHWISKKGFPGPTTVIVDSAAKKDWKAIIHERIGFPCIIKPAYTFEMEERTGRKLIVADNINELDEHLHRLDREETDIVVQEIVKGRSDQQYSLAGFCDASARIAAWVMTNKRRQNYFGAGTFVSSANIPELYDLGESLLRELSFKGIFEIEFKKDDTDGTFKIIEVNPRCWSQILLATRMKVNVACIAFFHASGQNSSFRTRPSEDEKYWINFEGDWQHIKRLMFDKRPNTRQLFRILSSVPAVEPFNLKDVGPGIYYIRTKLMKKPKRKAEGLDTPNA